MLDTCRIAVSHPTDIVLQYHTPTDIVLQYHTPTDIAIAISSIVDFAICRFQVTLADELSLYPQCFVLNTLYNSLQAPFATSF